MAAIHAPERMNKTAMTKINTASDAAQAVSEHHENNDDEHRIENLCVEKNMRMTEQRRVIARVLSLANDHPDVEEVYHRASAVDSKISIATVYRTVRLFEEAGILERHEFGDGRARYEQIPESHHDHLINVQNREVIEFSDKQIEELQRVIAERLGFRLVGHRLELYCLPLEGEKKNS